MPTSGNGFGDPQPVEVKTTGELFDQVDETLLGASILFRARAAKTPQQGVSAEDRRIAAVCARCFGEARESLAQLRELVRALEAGS
jgi:hypothetical protein